MCYDLSNAPALVSGAGKTTCGKAPDAVATDGTSRQLLRLKSARPGQACFKVVPDGARDMGRTEPADSSVVYSAGDLASPYWAFGTWLPPNAFGNDPADSRTVTVEIAFTPTAPRANTLAVRKTILVKRPPVLLVHGLWSDPDTWSKDFKKPASPGTRQVEVMDYKATNAASFDVNIPKLGAQIADIVTRSRKDRIALTRVDVIAHSMGGLLTKGWTAVGGADGYRRADNFQAGDVHRLITLSTPHYGSQMANMLVNALNSYGPQQTVRERVPDPDYPYLEVYKSFAPVKTILQESGKWMKANLYCGAVCDLADNSPALEIPGASDVEARAYSATGGVLGQLFMPLDSVAQGFGPAMYQTHITPYLYTVPHDVIVAEDSQRAGLPGDNDPFAIHYHIGLPLTPDGITNSDFVVAASYADLDSDAPGWFAPLPQVVVTGTGRPRLPGVGRGLDGFGVNIDEANYSAQCYVGGPMKPKEKTEQCTQPIP